MDNIKQKQHREIDIVGLVVTVLKEWRTLSKFVGVAAVIGVIVAISTPRQYTAEVILAPEMSGGAMGLGSSLADMASSFGLDLGSKSAMDAIYPEIYPDIFASSDFTVQLLDVNVALRDDITPRTYKNHLLHDLSHPFWTYPVVKLKRLIKKIKQTPKPAAAGKGKTNTLIMDEEESELCKGIGENILCVVDKKTSEITISISDQDPMVAAIMADTLQRRLQAYITEYRTKKARIDYEYYDKMATKAMAEYEKKANAYNQFADGHSRSVLASVNTKTESMLEEMQNMYSIYIAMVKMREQAQAKIQERTPAFTIIQSSKMPYKPSSRPKIFTLMIFVFFGGLLDAFWVLFLKDKYKAMKMKKSN